MVCISASTGKTYSTSNRRFAWASRSRYQRRSATLRKVPAAEVHAGRPRCKNMRRTCALGERSLALCAILYHARSVRTWLNTTFHMSVGRIDIWAVAVMNKRHIVDRAVVHPPSSLRPKDDMFGPPTCWWPECRFFRGSMPLISSIIILYDLGPQWSLKAKNNFCTFISRAHWFRLFPASKA